MGNDDFSAEVRAAEKRKQSRHSGKQSRKKETWGGPYLPVRGREPFDGGGQASRGEGDGLRAELFVGEGDAQHVKRVHLGNVHALALAASHLAAADVLAVVVLRVFSF